MTAIVRQRKQYHRITYDDRLKIEALNKRGVSIYEIAAQIGCDSNSLRRELRRCCPYDANVAQRLTQLGNGMKAHRMTYDDRLKIETLLRAGKSLQEIADVIGVGISAISRELQRGGEPYNADRAQRTLS